MAENKTKPTSVSVDDYLATKASPQQMDDCKAIIAMLKRIAKQPAKMWGPSIVGFGAYRYLYKSGHSGEAPLTGLAVRGRELVIYISCDDPSQAELLACLGKHKMGKSCLYFKCLADLDSKILEKLVAGSVAEIQERHPNISNA